MHLSLVAGLKILRLLCLASCGLSVASDLPPLVASPPTAILMASAIAWMVSGDRGLCCALDVHGVPGSSR